ncbi:hypothetical protein [Methanoregula sp. UBA64]|jgi:hypothetical protein|uniref:hypothetical protein n=1 Tax=Methanoregula sp. UBA64 TaxID=1915554 RepID=UPI0025F72C3E|nr:hypothetical protein [Methanoregula sp. UBA64]
MAKYAAVPDLVARFMEESGEPEQWVTVREIRERYGLPRYQSGTIAGFLHRLEFSSYGEFPYIVKKVEMLEREGRSSPLRYRYLLARRTGRCTGRDPSRYAGGIPAGTAATGCGTGKA